MVKYRILINSKILILSCQKMVLDGQNLLLKNFTKFIRKLCDRITILYNIAELKKIVFVVHPTL